MTALTRWTPFDDLFRLHRRLDRLFDEVFGIGEDFGRGPRLGFVPPVEMTSTDDSYQVRVALPGVDPKDVSIEVSGNVLTIRGEHRAERSDAEVSEFDYGRFERSLTLPSTIDLDKVTASYRHGVLELRMPWKESVKPRRIPIQTTEPKVIEAEAVHA
jgi:HSP20 family protein